MKILKFMLISVLTIGILYSNSDSGGQFSPEKFGIGATLTQADSVSPIIVKSCISGGPADRAGLLPGDQILKLDAHSIAGWSFDEVLHYLITEKPTMLKITVLRDSSQIGFELQRAKFSDIAAGINMKMVRSPDSLSWMSVPLEELAPLEIGSALIPGGVQDAHCDNTDLKLSGTRVSILYFWASWCGPCKLLMKKLDASKDTIRSSGIRVIGINVDTSCETFAAVNASLKPPGEQYWAGGYYGTLSQVLRVYRRGIPTGALVDQDGKLVKIATGVGNVLALFGSIPVEKR
jgi:thiol-disulfide isomerase/thioredoxin